MKLFIYIWRNVTRNKLRSCLTILSVAFSLALTTVLYGYLAMQDAWGQEAATRNRIVVMNKQGFSGPVPLAYIDRVRSIEGVLNAVPYSWFGGNYQEQQMPFAQFGTDPKNVFEVWNEMSIPADQLAQWQGDRQGCVADRRLAEKWKWKIGDRIPLQGTFFPITLDLKLVGLFDSPKPTDSVWFDLTYLDEELKRVASQASGNSGTIFARCDSTSVIPGIVDTIDLKFANSDNPTRTQTEAAFAQMFSDMLGNVKSYIRNIALAVIFSLTLVAGTAMAMSMRERTTEVAVLKAIGFTKSRILAMVLGESMMISMLGGLFGITAGAICLNILHGISSQFFPLSFLDMVGPWVAGLVAVGIGIGLVSGMVPAIQASRISVIDGLRRVI
jgi:putative ABC transport system permease protein